MRSPSLHELPPPPPGRTGWPWTEATPPLPARMADGRAWPRISIVTPSYNQSEFLEETIRSVLLQGYPDLEYVVVDGGSDDGSVQILEKYSPWLAHWTSERDRGQSHAINKGFRRTTGDVLAWLNSDDIYYPGALQTVATVMAAEPCDIVIGAIDKVFVDASQVRFVERSSATRGTPLHALPIFADGRHAAFHFLQPPMFWRRGIWERTGELDERYHHIMDLEWCTRAFARGAIVAARDEILARFALHPGSKTHDFRFRSPQERLFMYLRFSRMEGFRAVPCLLAGLHAAGRTLAWQARRRREQGRRLEALALRLGGWVMRGIHRGVTGVLYRVA